jgi:N-acetylmuramoyl-L-alanine amidase
MPTLDMVVAKLTAYGYKSDDNTNLLKAFQLHFRPSNYDGVLDADTAAIAYALVDKYIG